MTRNLSTITPVDGGIHVDRTLGEEKNIAKAHAAAVATRSDWKLRPRRSEQRCAQVLRTIALPSLSRGMSIRPC